MSAWLAAGRDVEDLRLLVRILGLTSVDQVVTLCAEVFPDEALPDRARLILEDLFAG